MSKKKGKSNPIQQGIVDYFKNSGGVATKEDNIETKSDKPEKRLAFNKEEGDFAIIDQQHLSNCWWFIKIFGNKSKGATEDTMELIKRQLISRFNGQLMEYRPHVGNSSEIKALNKMNMIQKAVGKLNTYDIIFDGHKIGQIRTTF